MNGRVGFTQVDEGRRGEGGGRGEEARRGGEERRRREADDVSAAGAGPHLEGRG